MVFPTTRGGPIRTSLNARARTSYIESSDEDASTMQTGITEDASELNAVRLEETTLI